MRKHSESVGIRGTSERSRRNRLTATTAAIGGAGIVLAVPGAALFSAPPAEAQLPDLGGLFGGAGLGGLNLADPLNGILDPIFNIFGSVPILSIFIGNGADGTSLHPNGGNA